MNESILLLIAGILLVVTLFIFWLFELFKLWKNRKINYKKSFYSFKRCLIVILKINLLLIFLILSLKSLEKNLLIIDSFIDDGLWLFFLMIGLYSYYYFLKKDLNINIWQISKLKNERGFRTKMNESINMCLFFLTSLIFLSLAVFYVEINFIYNIKSVRSIEEVYDYPLEKYFLIPYDILRLDRITSYPERRRAGRVKVKFVRIQIGESSEHNFKIKREVGTSYNFYPTKTKNLNAFGFKKAHEGIKLYQRQNETLVKNYGFFLILQRKFIIGDLLLLFFTLFQALFLFLEQKISLIYLLKDKNNKLKE